jgi:hypothetical protein
VLTLRPCTQGQALRELPPFGSSNSAPLTDMAPSQDDHDGDEGQRRYMGTGSRIQKARHRIHPNTQLLRQRFRRLRGDEKNAEISEVLRTRQGQTRPSEPGSFFLGRFHT